jgi:hypothetical protein
MQSARVTTGILVTGLLISSLISSTAIAASQCKGLAESACASDSSCRWVDGYVRKDGREVSAHCRLGSAAKASKESKAESPKVSAAK